MRNHRHVYDGDIVALNCNGWEMVDLAKRHYDFNKGLVMGPATPPEVYLTMSPGDILLDVYWFDGDPNNPIMRHCAANLIVWTMGDKYDQD